MVSHVGHFSHHFIEQIQVSEYVKHGKNSPLQSRPLLRLLCFYCPALQSELLHWFLFCLADITYPDVQASEFHQWKGLCRKRYQCSIAWIKKEKQTKTNKKSHLNHDLQVGNSQSFLPTLISLPATSHSFPTSLRPQIQVESFLGLKNSPASANYSKLKTGGRKI